MTAAAATPHQPAQAAASVLAVLESLLPGCGVCGRPMSAPGPLEEDPSTCRACAEALTASLYRYGLDSRLRRELAAVAASSPAPRPEPGGTSSTPPVVRCHHCRGRLWPEDEGALELGETAFDAEGSAIHVCELCRVRGRRAERDKPLGSTGQGVEG